MLDDPGPVRPKVVLIIDGRRSRGRVDVLEALGPGSRVHLLQALSVGCHRGRCRIHQGAHP